MSWKSSKLSVCCTAMRRHCQHPRRPPTLLCGDDSRRSKGGCASQFAYVGSMFTLLAFLVGCSAPVHAQEYMGRNIAQTMSYRGAPWLIRPERVVEENPALLLTDR